MQTDNLAFFISPLELNSGARFDQFIEWARPFGSAGINHIHAGSYSLNAPYFEWASEFLALGDKTTKSWFLKHEFIRRGREVFERTRQTKEVSILNRNGLFEEGRFLAFAKAYLNITTYYRGIRTPPKPLIQALCFLERSLRLLWGSSDPTRLTAKVFENALDLLKESGYTAGQLYDAGKELEILAGMIQGGYHSKTFRFADKGFRLLERSFAFTSSLLNRPRPKALRLNSADMDSHPARITLEEVTAVGLAYRKSISRYGPLNIRSFMAAIPGLALTTVSMRVSDLLTLQRDAIYTSEDDPERRRIRIGRPKIDVSQDLPIAKKLGDLTDELFSCLLTYSSEAHDAFRFYIRNYGEDFSAIQEIYIPKKLRHFFKREFLSILDVYKILRRAPSLKDPKLLPTQVRSLNACYYIEEFGDIWGSKNTRVSDLTKFALVEAVESHCAAVGLTINFPLEINRKAYVSAKTAETFCRGGKLQKKRDLLRPLFDNGLTANKYIRSDDLKKWLLEDFKVENRYPHWPYTTKDKTIRLDNALLVQSQLDFSPHTDTEETNCFWWQPIAVVPGQITYWISNGADGRPPLLFQQLNVQLSDASYPSITLHATRRYHHTQALLAGAHEVFIDELAGRKSGTQSEYYDLRSPREIILRSIETFDPDEDFPVAGPIAEKAKDIKLTDRRSFLYRNAVPKHITEIGGCATDWSLDPCKQHGDCMRCDQQLWRKGDEKRLPHIIDRKAFSIDMITVAKEKISHYSEPPRSLLLQLRQFEDSLARCNAILAAEADDSILLGTIITFSQPTGTMTVSELTTQLASSKKGKGT